MKRGSCHTKKSIEKMKFIHKGLQVGEENPFYGKHHSEENIEKMRIVKLGEKNPFYGEHHTKEAKEKISKGNIGKIFSKETRLKMSEAKREYIPWNKGKKCPQLSGINNSFYGKQHTLETKRKISEIRKELGLAKGRNNPMYGKRREDTPNWRGGISFEPYAFEFNRQLKELIRQRDNYKCQKCGMPEIENNKKLAIHHIDYNKKNCLPLNLISLCNKCNAKVNFNRDFWEEYFKEIILEKVN